MFPKINKIILINYVLFLEHQSARKIMTDSDKKVLRLSGIGSTIPTTDYNILILHIEKLQFTANKIVLLLNNLKTLFTILVWLIIIFMFTTFTGIFNADSVTIGGVDLKSIFDYFKNLFGVEIIMPPEPVKINNNIDEVLMDFCTPSNIAIMLGGFILYVGLDYTIGYIIEWFLR